MDTLRGNYRADDAQELDGYSVPDAYVPDEDDAVDHAPPPAIGTDERRMQVRAYNFWASLLEDRNYPSIEDVDPTLLPDFGPNSVLLDFTDSIEDPAISYIGMELASECAPDGELPERLSQVQPRSLLSRITDHYMQILANQSPIGFEAEFVNHAGATILYRGILLPFSSDDDTIDFIFGVINWKEIADARSSDELLLEIDQALEAGLSLAGSDSPLSTDLTDWADGPASTLSSAEDVTPSESENAGAFAGMIARPSFDLTGQSDLPAAADDEPFEMAHDVESVELADWLALARDTAQEAKSSEERTRAALYDAVSRAWDFALAAADNPGDFAEMLEDAGLTRQVRAPMTPIVKLVFGIDYDKTRLTEYAAVLNYAQRTGIGRGELGDFLKTAEGGLKGVIAEERAFRRAQDGKAPKPARKGPRKAIAKKLRAMDARDFADLPVSGEEFALIMIRRNAEGGIEVLGEVPENAALIEKAARQLID